MRAPREKIIDDGSRLPSIVAAEKIRHCHLCRKPFKSSWGGNCRCPACDKRVAQEYDPASKYRIGPEFSRTHYQPKRASDG